MSQIIIRSIKLKLESLHDYHFTMVPSSCLINQFEKLEQRSRSLLKRFRINIFKNPCVGKKNSSGYPQCHKFITEKHKRSLNK